MGAATRNLSLALQQCDVKQNMAVRSKLVSRFVMAQPPVQSIQGLAESLQAR